MKIISGSITAPKGFKTNGLCCGIKQSGKPDLALIYSDLPAATAAVFTKNSVKAAPVLVSQKHIKNNKAQAIVINSGNANCFTGKFGLIYAEHTAELISKLLCIPKNDVIVASTGIIGKPFPFKKILKFSKKLVGGLKKDNPSKAAKAILTTDTKTKELALEITINNKKIKMGAIAKGSGMIAPNMATMLAFITTDAAISPRMLKLALKNACDQSFNCITVDGCMSTNDMAVVMANGMAKNKPITNTGKAFNIFSQSLNHICLDMAKKIVLDGEGASKFIEINVISAKTEKQAKKFALAIANSNLVKTANYTNNPNWGRVAAAIGSLGIKSINEKNLKISFKLINKKEISITAAITLGNKNATAYTSDLTAEYIKINGEYN